MNQVDESGSEVLLKLRDLLLPCQACVQSTQAWMHFWPHSQRKIKDCKLNQWNFKLRAKPRELKGADLTLYGPAHGGANEAALRMFAEIGAVENVAAYVERVKNKEFRLMGVGHPVYRHYDPRAVLIKQVAYEVFEVTGSNPLIDIALEVERVVLEDDYFVSRRLNPNVDFYSGLIYQALDMMTVVFAIPRTVGWLAHWSEMLDDPDYTAASDLYR